ncbi:hypothetical protein GCM10017643_28470 [Ancylobacter dichloromethanicus]|uniref:Uncharacterized protein n=1 Tax=Ancylobacter dichloromethanicus TaxID=518825 RepID=A0A9W6N017_9HYPH|nr:hypothetical protein GCM10017643_28470 [Ancylobacter dichloromethanicus]
MRLAQIVAGQARAAIEQQHGFLAGAEQIGDDAVRAHHYLTPLMRLDLTPHCFGPSLLNKKACSIPREIGSPNQL